MIEFILKSFLPGLLVILLAFVAASQPSPLFSFLGFICFFVVGVTLIVEGWKRRKSNDSTGKRKE